MKGTKAVVDFLLCIAAVVLLGTCINYGWHHHFDHFQMSVRECVDDDNCSTHGIADVHHSVFEGQHEFRIYHFPEYNSAKSGFAWTTWTLAGGDANSELEAQIHVCPLALQFSHGHTALTGLGAMDSNSDFGPIQSFKPIPIIPEEVYEIRDENSKSLFSNPLCYFKVTKEKRAMFGIGGISGYFTPYR